MMHKVLITAAAFAVIVLGVAWFGSPQNNAPPQAAVVDAGTSTSGEPTPATPSPTPTPTAPTPKTYTLAQVATHKNSSSCWAAINGKVYDLTLWINQHPGGPERILSICGTDATSAFNAQHGGQSRPANELANFYIGDLQ